EVAAIVFGGRAEIALRDVAETFLIADAAGEPGAEPAAAKHVVGHHDGGIVRILIVDFDHFAGDEEGVRLVGGLDLLIGGRNVPVHVGDARVAAGALPSAEEFAGQPGNLRGAELTGNGDFAHGGAIELLVELAHIVERDLLEVLDLLVGGGDVAQVAARIGVHAVLELGNGERLGIAAAGFGGGDALLFDGLEFALGEGRFAQDFGGEAERTGEVGLDGFDAGGGAGGAAGDIHLRLQAVDFVLDLLARLVSGAAHEEGGGEAGG